MALKQIEFKTYSQAVSILTIMKNYVHNHGYVTTAMYYALARVDVNQSSDTFVGWYDLTSAEIKTFKGGVYCISFPTPYSVNPYTNPKQQKVFLTYPKGLGRTQAKELAKNFKVVMDELDGFKLEKIKKV